MRFYKLRVTTNAANIATTFNEQFTPEAIPETNDPFRVDWVSSADEEHVVGEKVNRPVRAQDACQLLTVLLGIASVGSHSTRLCCKMADRGRKVQHQGLPFEAACAD